MRRGLLAACACLLLAGLGAAPARAATPAEIAGALRRDPVYVDPSVASSATVAEQHALRTAIARSHRAIYAVFLPLTVGDTYHGDTLTVLSLVHSRLERDGIYLTADASGTLTAEAFGPDADAQENRIEAASDVANFETAAAADLPGIEHATRFVDAFRDPNLAQRQQATDRRMRALDAENEGQSRPHSSASALWIVVIALAAVLVLLTITLIVRARRRARPSARGAVTVPTRVAEHARVAQAHELREQVEHALIAFSERADQLPSVTAPAAEEAQQHALDSYSAARKVLARGDELVDLVGARLLAEQGSFWSERSQALQAGRRPPAPPRHCFFDPRHHGRLRDSRWQRGLHVPACPACHADVVAGRAPEALTHGGHPWFDADDVWARTGYGLWCENLATEILAEHAPDA